MLQYYMQQSSLPALACGEVVDLHDRLISQGKQSESADVEGKEGSPVTDGANQAMKRECSASRDHGGLSPQSKHRDRDRESHQSASAERDKRHRSSRDEKHSHSQSKRQSRSLSRRRPRSKERRSVPWFPAACVVLLISTKSV